MRTSRLIAIAGLALFGLSSHASAAVLDTITGGSCSLPLSLSCGTNRTLSSTTQSLAVSFTLGATTTITSVEAYIYSITPAQSATLGIMNDSSGVPSGTFIDSSPITPGAGPANLTSLSWSLAAGTYWLAAVATSGSSLVWMGDVSLVTPWAVGNGTGGGWTADTLPSSIEPAALISGTTSVSTVPLPATLPLFATGLGALGLLGWRRKKKAASLNA